VYPDLDATMLLASPRENGPRRPDHRWGRAWRLRSRVEYVGRSDDDAPRRLIRVARQYRGIAIYSRHLRA
jgi:hypothetical protein